MWAERSRPSAPAWLLILGLHLGLLALINVRARHAEPARSWTELRLIPAQPAPAHVDVSSPPPRLQPEHALRSAPRAIEVPALAPFAVDTPPAGPAPADPASSTTTDIEAPPPLRLTLPSAALAAPRQPALDDPRGNTPISRFGARIAHDLGDDGRWIEERMDGDFVRLRRGNTCVNLHRGRGAALQPFNESVVPTLWGATPAYRCERR
jgi:hypothetical protein